jgi:hypothetical protein
MPERKKLDLRRRPAAPPPPAAAPTIAPDAFQDVLAPDLFQPGQVLDPRYMTAFERQQLASIGWEEGTPVPGNAAELIRGLQQEATAAGVLPVPADTPPLKVPPPVDIGRLPPARQRELYAALKQAGDFQRHIGEREAAVAGLDPSIAEAVRVADDVATAGRPARGVSVVDDRPAAARAPAAAPPPPRPTGWARPAPPEPPATAVGWHRPAAAQPTPPPAPEPDLPPVGELSDAGGVGITHCPHCGWELLRADPSTPDDDDKRAYLMAALAGPGHRFSRESELLGGLVKVGYRELTGGEADAALTQIADDVRSGRIVGDGEWWQRLMDYRMTQSIDYIEIRGVGRVHEGVDFNDIEADDGQPTVYPALVGHLLESVLQSESLRRAVGLGFMRFQRMCEKLEANADDGSFWEGIGSPH